MFILALSSSFPMICKVRLEQKIIGNCEAFLDIKTQSQEKEGQGSLQHFAGSEDVGNYRACSCHQMIACNFSCLGKYHWGQKDDQPNFYSRRTILGNSMCSMCTQEKL